MSISVMVFSCVFFSSARTRSRKACRWRSVAAFFSQAALSSNGNTPRVGARLADRARDQRSRRRWCTSSAIVEVARRSSPPPPIMQCAPIVGAAGDADAAGDRGVRADAQLWPIWIWLSSLTPSSITVSSSAPRSMEVLAPISTSSPMRTRADLRDLLPAALRRARCRSRRRRSPRRSARCRARRCVQPRVDRHARGAAACRRRRRRRAPTTQCAPIDAPLADRRAPASTTANGADAARRRRRCALGIDDRARDARRRTGRAACARPTTASGARSRGRDRR